jgi:hypothetical protein
MRSAEGIVREVDAGLDLPVRRRVALLRELRSDFDDLVATLEAAGATPEAARLRALTLLVPTACEMGALADLHRPAYARLAGRLPSRHPGAIELVGVCGMVAVATFALLLTLTEVAGLSQWAGVALGCVGAVVLAHIAWQVFRFMVRQDANAAELARAVTTQAGLVGLTLAVGGLATIAEGYAAAGSWAAGHVFGGLTSTLARCAETAALTLSIVALGAFGAAAMFQAYLSTREAEEELGLLLAAVPPHAGDQAS